ncbi:MAG: hypothetical protein LBJ79_00790 [Endomicrobium sp.]|nr:hypothetical protein [Endomicrobium sp.]
MTKLFWVLSASAMDSLVSNYTALNKFRTNDDLPPCGINNRRSDKQFGKKDRNAKQKHKRIICK